MDLFFETVELTSIYWKGFFELYEPTDDVLEISDPMRDRFRNIVCHTDLSSPLEEDIFQKAKEALIISKAEGVKRKNREAKIHKFRERELKESKAALNCES